MREPLTTNTTALLGTLKRAARPRATANRAIRMKSNDEYTHTGNVPQ
jgi:hypothetical protein